MYLLSDQASTDSAAEQ